VTAVATVILVWATTGNARQARELASQAKRQADLTESLAKQAALQGWILERQGMLATLPAMVLESHGHEGAVVIKNKGQPPALNVEFRYLAENRGTVTSPQGWQWIDAVMAKLAQKQAERPRRGTVHAQVRFADSLGTLYLVERRWLGGGAKDAYRLFRWRDGYWEHLTFCQSDQQPLLAESDAP
jgi:hypothetical protein